jgi:regulator of protease activity HflC (stomatin/prohibitin superfamily)
MLRQMLYGQNGLPQRYDLLCMQLLLFICLPTAHIHRYFRSYIVGIVEQFGRFTRMLQPGFNYINPCSESVVEVDMRMRVNTVGRQIVMTKDNIQLTMEASVYYRVINPLKVKYLLGLANVFPAIR